MQSGRHADVQNALDGYIESCDEDVYMIQYWSYCQRVRKKNMKYGSRLKL